MSYIEAQRDGIPMKRDRHGKNIYYPPCHICGGPVYSWVYKPGNRYTCRACKEKDSTKKHIKALVCKRNMCYY